MSIAVHNVRKTFGAFTALDGVDLSVPSGRLVALLGPSGSGKTTLLRIIAGLEYADPGSGRIQFHGEDVTDVPAGRRKVGFVFQHYALFRHMTVFENIAFGLRVRGRRERPSKSEITDRVNKLLKLVQLEGLDRRFPTQLSGGQRQRVALARALAVEPKVVLADEPTSMLDVSIRIGILNLMIKLKEEHDIAFLYVTHDLASARYLADDILVMYAGQIVERGPVEQVLAEPLHPYTQLLLAAVHGERIVDRGVGGGAAAVDPGPGCRFVDRCPLAIPACSATTPELVETAAGHAARCFVTAPSPTST